MASAPPLPDYYTLLSISSTASVVEIRSAYKRAALKHHPDRVPADSPERPARTKRFQQVNDAYYTLSDPTRRREYDEAYKWYKLNTANSSDAGPSSGTRAKTSKDNTPKGKGKKTSVPDGYDSDEWTEFSFPAGSDSAHSMPGGWNWDSSTFYSDPDSSSHQFQNAFEEMLRDQNMATDPTDDMPHAQPTGRFWALVGGASGGTLGFIIGNLPGAVAGAVAGNRLGAIRDTRGKSVYEVFQELPAAERTRVLGELAAKVFAHAVGS
jgi:curved DNA-binding protein CbpA